MDLHERLGTALADRYRIERELGQGGMATVFLAADLRHQRHVAIKVLKPDLAAVLGADRFVQEITTTAQLQHPHILPLFDSGTADGFLFYVMPYIEGETLRDKLTRESQLGVEEAIRIAREVADALDYAHRRGVIHRDIKPENILLHDGRPMVADFGIALAVSAAAGGRMTETGLSLGTPHYMSPEQATAEKEITARSDVYSLASVLYEMLTGEPPHHGGSAQQVIMKIVTDTPRPVTELRKAVPPNVAAALATALEKLPADRFPSAKAFADALANPQFVGTTTLSGQRQAVASPSARPVVTILLAGLAAVALGLAAWGWLRTGPEPATTREWVRLSLLRPGGALPEFWPVSLAISADGSMIAFTDSADTPEGWRLMLKEQGSAMPRPIPGTALGFNPFFSPDGEWIGFATPDGLYRIPRSGGAPVKLSDSTAGLPRGVYASGVWLDDGTIIFAGRDNRHLFQIDADGGPERVVLPASAWNAQSLVRLQGLPGSRGVLIIKCRASPCTHGALWLLDLKRDTLVELLDGPSGGWYLPSGHLLYGRADGTLFAQPFDLDAATLRGTATPVMTGLRTTSGLPALVLSPAGTVLHDLRGDSGLAVLATSLVSVDREGTPRVLERSLSLPGSEQGVLGIAPSPDGRLLALVQNTRDDGPQVFVKQVPDGPLTRLSFQGWGGRPAWTPDGSDLVYIQQNETRSVVARLRADGTGQSALILEEPRRIAEVLVSPDGEWLIYRTEATAAGAGDVMARRLRGDTTTRPLLATPAQEVEPALSPDGRWLAYSSDEGGTFEVFLRPWPDVNSGKVQVSRGGGGEPVWNPDGRELFYRAASGDLMAVTIDPTSSAPVGQVRVLFSASPYQSGGFHPGYAVSRDGQHFLFGRVERQGAGASHMILVRNWFTELRPLLQGR